MNAVLNITAPIFFLILLGFIAIRFKLLPKEALPALSKFVLYMALPSVMITKIAALDLAAVINVPYMLVYALAGLTVFVVTLMLARFVLKERWSTSGVSAMGGMMPNSAFIGFPILLQFLDTAPAQAFAMALVVENILFLPLGLIFVESVHGHSGGTVKFVLAKVAKRIATNPIILAVFFGVLMSMLGLHFPRAIGGGLELLAQAAAPAALIVIGGSLVGVVIKGDKLRIGLVTSMKLILFPTMTFILLQFFPAMPYHLKAGVLVFSTVPMFSVYPIIGGEYGQRDFCASVLLVTTILSFFSISLMLHYLS
ncbi:AEC family transporter [Marinomonas ostreistagni]|uniref:AEC family transporter n=1 Tax=Marinomonas ostreistagni TaxID=359209 RepID=UPI0019525477|nr:AEC family transporter [Marinomonas ostreistagni]MBM6550089.1 AEC family transporter [Marinomonas ostreistagni]